MVTEAQGEIKQHQIDYILKAIMVCALSKMQAENPENNHTSLLPYVQTAAITIPDSQIGPPILLPSKPHSWANIAIQNPPHTKSTTKPSLA